MSVFTVDLKNQPGELAPLCEAMAGRGVNLIPCVTTCGKTARWRSLPMTRPAPSRTDRYRCRVHPALTIRMENRPGAGAAKFRKLADAGVNADLLVPVRVSDDLFFAVICVDDLDRARCALGVRVVS
jgi:hypothetical protein